MEYLVSCLIAMYFNVMHLYTDTINYIISIKEYRDY